MVTGKVEVIKEGGVSYTLLTTSSEKRYILCGLRAEELRDISDERVTVIGIPRKPLPTEIKGKPIRLEIEVENINGK